MVYCEQVGVYRQAFGKYGDKAAWYTRTNQISTDFNILV